MTVNKNKYDNLTGKLLAVSSKDFFTGFTTGLNLSLSIIILLLLIILTSESVFYFSINTRTLLFYSLLLLSLILLFFNTIKPALKYFKAGRLSKIENAAVITGRFYTEIKDELLNTVQLADSSSSEKYYSPALINAAFDSLYNKTEKLEFAHVISSKKTLNSFYILLSVIVISLILFFANSSLAEASYRLLNFRTEFIAPDSFGFEVYPGNCELLKGKDLNVSVKIKGKVPDEVFIAVKFYDQTDFNYIKAVKADANTFTVKLTGIRSNAEYFASSGDVKSADFKITIIDNPVITNLNFKIFPPSYSGVKPYEQKDNGSITGLTGTKVEINLTSSNPLAESIIYFSDTTTSKMIVTNNTAKGYITIRKDVNYKIILKDTKGNKSQFPVEYSLKTLFDDSPSITMLFPNGNTSLAADNKQQLIVSISDDYGFSKLLIKYRISESTFRELDPAFSEKEIVIVNSQKEQEVNYTWDLTGIGLAEKEVLSYYIEVYDNDIISGPKTAKTGMFNIRIPSLNELLNKADDVQNAAQNDVKQILKEAEELKKNLENIDRELKQDKKELTWKEKEKIENAVNQFKSLQEKIKNTREDMKQLQNELKENNLLSKETMQKYMELQKLLEEFSGEDFKKAMEKMQNSLNNMNRQMTQEEMRNMKMDEEKFRASIERTLELMKRIQVEQKMDEMIKRADDLIKQQDELNKQASQQNSNEQNKQIAEKQKDVTKKLNQLQKEMSGLKKKMNDMKDMPNEEMEKLEDEFDKDKNSELSENTEQELMQQKMNSARQKMSQISKNMQKTKSGMMNMQQKMNQQNQMQTYSDMMKLTNNIISLSKKQEELKKETNKSELSTENANKLADKQNKLSESLDNLTKQLGDLSKKTFAISPEMGKSLGDAKRQMQNSTMQLQNRNSGTAQLTQSEAMRSLNEAASMMKSSMESMMQGGGQGGGMMSLMQQLGQYSGQQMNLNNMTKQLQQMQGGSLSPQQQGELQRLSMQQQLLRKSMEQLNREAQLSGESKKLPGNMQDIAKQMDEVISEMQTNKISEDLIKKQDKILSKMLDLQKSLNERDYESERESYTGQNIKRESPGNTTGRQDNVQNKIRDELNKSVREGYKKDYETVIKNYFEKLQQK